MRLLAFLALISAMLFSAPLAQAQDEIPCIQMLGDFWAEEPAPADVRTIDGTTVKTPEALAKAVGDGGIVRGGNFAEWDFRSVVLRNACFVEADLKGSVWTAGNAAGVGFIKSDLSHASLVGIRAPKVLFRDAILNGVKANRADFSGGRFEGGWFDGGVDGWVIDEANLTDFAFSCGITLADGCPVYSGGEPVSAKRANFTRARLSSFRSYGFMDLGLAGAVLDHTEISPEQLGSLFGFALEHPLVLVGGDSKVTLAAADAMALIKDSSAYTALASGPSFDCAKAASAAEKLLCSDTAGDLPDMDRQLGALFAEARTAKRVDVAEQRQWLKQRDACMIGEYPSDCLRIVYRDRTGVLLSRIGERDWLKPGQGALFVEDSLPLSDAMRASPLFARIAPVLASASDAAIYAFRAADGSYSVTGEAVGANAHICSLGADGLRLDPLTGWYAMALPGKAGKARVVRVMGDWLGVFENGRPDGDMPEAEMDFVSCGMRAAFVPLRRIDLPTELLRRYADQYTQER